MPTAESDLRAPDWFRNVVFYELSVRTFYDSNGDGIGDLPGVTEKLDYLSDLGVGAIWLLPFYTSPWRDDGYDVSDHYSVDPRLGTVEDLDRLVEAAHARGIRVIGDLVANHVSDQHPWFQEARKSRDSPYRSWFLWSDTGKEFSNARLIFPDFEKSNWTWDEVAGQYFFHRFFRWQPDLNYDTSAVRGEILRYARFWLGHGLDGFRCDAVPYLYKREGTTCANLPEVHQFYRDLRSVMDAEYHGTVLVSEANGTIAETVAYFDQSHEFPMVMNFPLMPNVFLGFAEKNPRRILDVVRATLPGVPPDCGWAYFLRNHDELTLERMSEDERALFFRELNLNPSARVNSGVRRRLAPLLGGSDASVLLLTGLILALPGAPFLYYGDEIGMGDRLDLGDRDAVRTPMQWSNGANAGFSTAPPERLTRPLVTDPAFAPSARNVVDEEAQGGSLLAKMRAMLRVRAAHAAVFGSDAFEGVDLGNEPIFGFWRAGGEYHLLCLYNFDMKAVEGTIVIPGSLVASPVELLRGGVSSTVGGRNFRFRLAPRAFSWTMFLARRERGAPKRAAPTGG